MSHFVTCNQTMSVIVLKCVNFIYHRNINLTLFIEAPENSRDKSQRITDATIVTIASSQYNIFDTEISLVKSYKNYLLL